MITEAQQAALERHDWTVTNSHGTEREDGARLWYFKDAEGNCSGIEWSTEAEAWAGAWLTFRELHGRKP